MPDAFIVIYFSPCFSNDYTMDRVTTDSRLQMLRCAIVSYTYHPSRLVRYRRTSIPDTTLFLREINNNKRMYVGVYSKAYPATVYIMCCAIVKEFNLQCGLFFIAYR